MISNIQVASAEGLRSRTRSGLLELAKTSETVNRRMKNSGGPRNWRSELKNGPRN